LQRNMHQQQALHAPAFPQGPDKRL